MEKSNSKCGFIVIIGAPNVGKSTLINYVVGTKVSIVSPKVQTTRSKVLGISITGNCQLILVDTPGIFAPKRRLDRAMVHSAWGGTEASDLILLLVDSKRGLDSETRGIINNLKRFDKKRKILLILNKVDLIQKDKLLNLTEKLNQIQIFHKIFMISAKNGDGIDDLLNEIKSIIPAGPWLFPEDQISDMPLRLLSAEITREKLYLKLHQELPYSTIVETEQWQEKKDGSIRIEQTIFVERESQRSIVLGKGGKMIKSIGLESRLEFSKMVETTVHLFLFVKVREKWGDNPIHYSNRGLKFDA
ncbi:MAG: GTPase Era [Rhodospirillales bacterium]|tara:strand:+ start:12883 stop:13791 length:909 start_codon:yes stop_codon:yes gene_type:complete